MIRVVIAEDHHLLREAIHILLDQADDIDVVGEASDGQQALESVIELVPDVLVVDITMPKMNGIMVTEEIRSRNLPTQIVILSIHSTNTIVRQALRAGALGYIVKRSASTELLEAIRHASVGKRYLTEIVNTINYSDDDSPYELNRLTIRERQVLQLIAEGQTNKEIAESLSLHIKTIEKHRANLIEKLDVHDIPALVQIALKLGLISLE